MVDFLRLLLSQLFCITVHFKQRYRHLYFQFLLLVDSIRIKQRYYVKLYINVDFDMFLYSLKYCNTLSGMFSKSHIHPDRGSRSRVVSNT